LADHPVLEELQMSKLVAGVALALCLSIVPALAQSDADTDVAIDSNLGDHTLYRAAFDALQAAVAEDDKAAFAEWVSYPITVTVAGEEKSIDDAEQFVAQYDGIITDEISGAIADQTWAGLFVNYQGVMFGDGQVWMNGICTDDTCTSFDVKVITIQSTSN
jgi:hypothetical protein